MMNKLFKGAFSAALMTLAVSAMAEKGEQWLTDMDKAQKVAAAEGKDIFMFFTGSDWCGWCIKLDDEVLSKGEFLDYAKDNLVLVELDFPQDEDLLSAEQRAHNERWKELFQPSGFPTVYLTDASANAYAKTGYKSGGPQVYIEHLKAFEADRKAVQEIQEKAQQFSGLEKAKLLDELLAQYGGLIGNKGELVSEIIALTKGKDDAMYHKYRMQKGSKDLLDGARILMKTEKSADQKLADMIEIFSENSFVKEGEALEMFLEHYLRGAFSMAGKHEQGVVFFAEKAADESYDLSMRQKFTVYQGLMYADAGDEIKAVDLVDEAIDMDPDALEGLQEKLYGQIRQIIQKRKLQGAP